MDNLFFQGINLSGYLRIWGYNGSMDINESIKNILFDMIGNMQIHKFTEENLILEVDYEEYTKKILELFKNPGDK